MSKKILQFPAQLDRGFSYGRLRSVTNISYPLATQVNSNRALDTHNGLSLSDWI